jgi:hypothetical protein
MLSAPFSAGNMMLAAAGKSRRDPPQRAHPGTEVNGQENHGRSHQVLRPPDAEREVSLLPAGRPQSPGQEEEREQAQAEFAETRRDADEKSNQHHCVLTRNSEMELPCAAGLEVDSRVEREPAEGRTQVGVFQQTTASVRN